MSRQDAPAASVTPDQAPSKKLNKAQQEELISILKAQAAVKHFIPRNEPETQKPSTNAYTLGNTFIYFPEDTFQQKVITTLLANQAIPLRAMLLTKHQYPRGMLIPTEHNGNTLEYLTTAPPNDYKTSFMMQCIIGLGRIPISATNSFFESTVNIITNKFKSNPIEDPFLTLHFINHAVELFNIHPNSNALFNLFKLLLQKIPLSVWEISSESETGEAETSAIKLIETARSIDNIKLCELIITNLASLPMPTNPFQETKRKQTSTLITKLAFQYFIKHPTNTVLINQIRTCIQKIDRNFWNAPISSETKKPVFLAVLEALIKQGTVSKPIKEITTSLLNSLDAVNFYPKDEWRSIHSPIAFEQLIKTLLEEKPQANAFQVFLIAYQLKRMPKSWLDLTQKITESRLLFIARAYCNSFNCQPQPTELQQAFQSTLKEWLSNLEDRDWCYERGSTTITDFIAILLEKSDKNEIISLLKIAVNKAESGTLPSINALISKQLSGNEPSKALVALAAAANHTSKPTPKPAPKAKAKAKAVNGEHNKPQSTTHSSSQGAAAAEALTTQTTPRKASTRNPDEKPDNKVSTPETQAAEKEAFIKSLLTLYAKQQNASHLLLQFINFNSATEHSFSSPGILLIFVLQNHINQLSEELLKFAAEFLDAVPESWLEETHHLKISTPHEHITVMQAGLDWLTMLLTLIYSERPSSQENILINKLIATIERYLNDKDDGTWTFSDDRSEDIMHFVIELLNYRDIPEFKELFFLALRKLGEKEFSKVATLIDLGDRSFSFSKRFSEALSQAREQPKENNQPERPTVPANSAEDDDQDIESNTTHYNPNRFYRSVSIATQTDEPYLATKVNTGNR